MGQIGVKFGQHCFLRVVRWVILTIIFPILSHCSIELCVPYSGLTCVACSGKCFSTCVLVVMFFVNGFAGSGFLAHCERCHCWHSRLESKRTIMHVVSRVLVRVVRSVGANNELFPIIARNN